jgi:hypothetical protein
MREEATGPVQTRVMTLTVGYYVPSPLVATVPGDKVFFLAMSIADMVWTFTWVLL